jgi:hypothetical protein
MAEPKGKKEGLFNLNFQQRSCHKEIGLLLDYSELFLMPQDFDLADSKPGMHSFQLTFKSATMYFKCISPLQTS